ncbi:MAG: hypothetical protein Q9195_006585 [Heterodermia aff. obscurata]
MAEAMAVIGAVAATVGTINILKTWIEELLRFLQEYEDVGETLQSLDLSLIVHETNLKLWMRFWKLEQPTSRRFQSELWGKDTLPTIERIYIAISDALEKTRTELAELLREYFRPRAENQTQLGLTSIIDFREEATGARTRLSPKQIVVFIRKNGPSLKSRLEQVEERVSKLRDTSTNAFEYRHRTAVGRALTEEQLAQAATSMLVRMAIETRYASMGLYQSYIERVKSKSIILDVDLIDDGAVQLESVHFQNSVVLKYRFAVPWPSKPQGPLEIVIEGPFDPERQAEQSSMASGDRGFAEACYAALLKEKAEFKINCRAEVYSFRSRVPLDTLFASSASDLKPLVKLLYRLDLRIAEEPALYFPRSQRVKLAYKLIQCGLLISGTSWLAKLENKILKRTPRGQNGDYHFLLELSCDGEMANEETLAAISQHLFAVGVLLVELGLGQPVKSATWENNWTLYPDFETYTLPASLRYEQWQAQLTTHMGDDYTNATKYCLVQKSGSFWNTIHRRDGEPEVREKAYLEVLKEYYIRAYLP